MANQFKRARALAGLSSRNYDVNDMEMLEQYKQTKEFKQKEIKKKELIDSAKKRGEKIDYNKIHDILYPKKHYKVRARY